MFPSGWPGRGLLILRVTAGALLVHDGVVETLGASNTAIRVVAATSALVGVLVLIGLWTPIIGALSSACAASLFAIGVGDPRNTLCMIALGLAVSMLGPGVWSVDAAIFGRHRIDIPTR